MRYWVVDSETTGVGMQDKAVEVAGFYVVDGVIERYHQSLVNPGIPIPPGASAVHHLVDEDVAEAPAIEEAMEGFFEVEFDFVIAHNASFDKRFMDFGECPWACTYKLAMGVYPDAESHSNMFLYYWLKLQKRVHSQGSAHRALFDSEGTTYLFQHLLSKATSEDPVGSMISFCNKPILLKKCKFGKHKDKMWKDVPRDYLDYILNKSSGWDENVLHTARHYYERR